ncbi:MAG: DUF2889 domain-containing protein, partial [Candidatus Rokubacteria bacterium]|nr:DUF2889 domain-containing protein [Candidatus Rokubacteria bacterium]
MITSPYLDDRDHYERSMEGWVDNTHDDAFTHTVRLTDDDAGVELVAVCTPSPGYEVREAVARVLVGAVNPAAAGRFGQLGGARMVAGFSRRLTELAGSGPGSRLLVDAGIEIARLARQATKLPREATAGLLAGGARACWDLDTTGWIDLPGSCFTYSSAGRALLETRVVSTPMVADLYSPPSGARRIFVRKKVMRLVRTGSRLHLFHSMHDNVHGFDLHIEIDLETGTVAAADSITSRLPYQGICTEPQGKIRSLVGQPADGELRKRIQTQLGGESGCAQLYDLTADLLKLLS